MPDLADLVDCDDPVVTDLLASTLELVVEAGGWVSAEACLLARGGQLSLTSGGDEDAPLLRVPRSAMVRVDRVTWGADPDRLVILDVPDDMGDVELQMLYVQVALHNQCGKTAWLARTHPTLAALPDPVVDAVRAVVPSFRADPLSPGDVLWANRCFRIALPDAGSTERVLVPVVDLLNHHASGATGSWDGREFTVDTRRPFGTLECALDYGMDRDAMELAVVYGFADLSATIAHTAPVIVDVPGIGEVEVDRLTFDLADRDACVRQVMSASGWSVEDSTVVARSVADAGGERLAAVLAACADAPDSPAAQTLAAAARHQAAVLAGGRP